MSRKFMAGGRNAAPGHPALRSHAAGLVSGEWPRAHRRRPGPVLTEYSVRAGVTLEIR